MMADVKFYWSLLLRRLPVMMAIVVICSALGLVQAVRLPASYTAGARLLVENAVISENAAGAALADEQIQIIRERLMTRANLIDIASDFDVFENFSGLSPDIIVALMTANSQIINRGGRDQATVINVSFSARSGQIAADVVNEYVTRITEASVAVTRGAVEDTLEFYQQEVERLSTDLASRSAQISQFQSENADALPGGQEFRLSRQAVLQERLASAQREMSSLIDQRARIVAIYEDPNLTPPSTDLPLTDDQRQLRDLERELAQLLTIYSESAPQVVTMRRRIDQLRSEVVGTSNTNSEGPINPSQAILNLQLAQIDEQVEDLQGAIAEAGQELEQLSSSIARTPLNSIQLQTMERDYETIRTQYDRAVAELAAASAAQRITVSNRGQRITLIEAASVPRSPTSPNRKLIAFLGGMVGIALAAGLFVLLEILNRTARRPVEITRALSIEPLAAMPYIETRSERLQRFGMRALALFLVLAGLPGGLWAVDTYYMPLDQLADQLLSQLRDLI